MLGSGDKKLVKRMQRGEEAAFQQFFDNQFPRLYRFALVRVQHDHDAAEEIAQATLCKVVRKLDSYRGEAALFTWICTFCRHEISAFYQHRQRAQSAIPLVEDTPQVRAALESLAAFGDNQEDVMQRRDMARLVQVALDYLAPNHSQALRWKYLEDLTVKEIADRLDLSTKATESLLTRARLAFRDGFSTLIRGQQQTQARS